MTLTPGATSWDDVMTFGAKLPWSHSNRKWVSKHWTVILRKKILWKLTITGELVGDALENKKIVLKQQRKEKQFDGL